MFRLTHFYKYKFPANLTNIDMNLDNIFFPQQGPYEWDYSLQRYELNDTFSDNLKRLLYSTNNISDASEMVPTPQNLKGH